MPNPLTGYDPSSGNSSGIGGRVRESKIMSTVDAASETGTPSAQAPTSQSGPTQGMKTHPAASSYAPSEDSAVVSHVYGSPIEGNGPSK
jgi:hypothetical protein